MDPRIWHFYKHEEIVVVMHALQILLQRKIPCDTHCYRYGSDLKDTLHALVRCDFSMAVWENSVFYEIIRGFRGSTMALLLLFADSKLNHEDLELFCVLL